jgi:hypothetical protein
MFFTVSAHRGISDVPEAVEAWMIAALGAGEILPP